MLKQSNLCKGNSMKESDKLILVGVISSAHGVKGEVIVKSFTADPASILKMPLITSQGEELKLKLKRSHPKGGLICTVGDIIERTRAENFVGCKIYCPRGMMPALAEEEFYIEDIKGLPVVDARHNQIGKVSGIFNFGAGDIIEIKFNNNEKKLFPFRKEMFPEITKDYLILKHW